MPRERAAPGLPSANPSSFYELAGIVAGQPLPDPSIQRLKLPRASSSVVVLLFCVVLLVVVGMAISFAQAYTVPGRSPRIRGPCIILSGLSARTRGETPIRAARAWKANTTP